MHSKTKLWYQNQSSWFFVFRFHPPITAISSSSIWKMFTTTLSTPYQMEWRDNLVQPKERALNTSCSDISAPHSCSLMFLWYKNCIQKSISLEVTSSEKSKHLYWDIQQGVCDADIVVTSDRRWSFTTPTTVLNFIFRASSKPLYKTRHRNIQQEHRACNNITTCLASWQLKLHTADCALFLFFGFYDCFPQKCIYYSHYGYITK